jgi:hypothetical protein
VNFRLPAPAPVQQEGVILGQWLANFRAKEQTEAEQAAEYKAAEEARSLAALQARKESPPVPVQHPEGWRVMPVVYRATSPDDVLELWVAEGAEFGWFTVRTSVQLIRERSCVKLRIKNACALYEVLEVLRRLVKLERKRGGEGGLPVRLASVGVQSLRGPALDRDDPRLHAMLDLLRYALAQGAMTSTFRLGRSSTDLSDTRVALENLELTHTPAYTVLRAVIDFEGNQRVTKETEGRPGEM